MPFSKLQLTALKKKRDRAVIGTVVYTEQDRKLVVDITHPPMEWANGSAIYTRAPKGPRWRVGYNERDNLIGHVVKFGGVYRAWANCLGEDVYCGEYKEYHEAHTKCVSTWRAAH